MGTIAVVKGLTIVRFKNQRTDYMLHVCFTDIYAPGLNSYAACFLKMGAAAELLAREDTLPGRVFLKAFGSAPLNREDAALCPLVKDRLSLLSASSDSLLLVDRLPTLLALLGRLPPPFLGGVTSPGLARWAYLGPPCRVLSRALVALLMPESDEA